MTFMGVGLSGGASYWDALSGTVGTDLVPAGTSGGVRVLSGRAGLSPNLKLWAIEVILGRKLEKSPVWVQPTSW